ncbi:unnamed protein product [Blepharisma stoltei]|uniref:60S ribosomal protein L13a n=1 Tax=Blepharisma stoltei TaxID=1481888 RepID=A0AAU9JDH6_9CILI|nr:unnamed protein product [Blepharisma stoltei]
MFKKEVVVDGRGHLLGRLASIVAKELLAGQHITVVRCDEINVTGHMALNRIKYMTYLRKRMNTNPKRGPFHFKAPSMMLLKAVRGMVPRKTPIGQAALDRLKAFDGVPHPYDTKKKMVIPDALRVLKLGPTRKYTVLGELAAKIGWKHKELIDKLENKRKERAKAWYQGKLDKQEAKVQAADRIKDGPLAGVLQNLEALGH